MSTLTDTGAAAETIAGNYTGTESRLAGAGATKRKILDAIMGTMDYNVSRLGAAGKFKSIAASMVSFDVPLQSSLLPIKYNGSYTPTFTRATTAYQTDFEGKQNLVRSGEARFQGARRVYNREGDQSEGNPTTATTSGTTPPTVTKQVAFLGKTAVSVAFVTGVASRTDSSAQIGSIPFNNTDTYQSRVSVVLSRALTGSEAIRIKGDGGNGNSFSIAINAANSPTAWKVFSGSTGTLSSSGTNRWFVEPTAALTSGLTVYITERQWEAVTGQTNQNPSEYVSVGVLSAPYHGAGVDGVQYFNTLNGNTVSSNIVSEATGAAIVAGAAGVSATAPVDAGGPQGILGSQAVTQYLGVTETPATQTTGSLGTGTYTLSVLAGTGSATSSAGTATITGGGAATLGSPNTFTVTVAGTVTVTVAGTVTRFSLNSGSFIKPYMANSGAAGTTATANADTDQYVSSGNIPASNNNFTLYGETTFPVVPSAASYYLWSSYVDANNSTSVLWDGTNLIARRRIGGTSHDATIALTPVAGAAFKWAAVFSSTIGTQIYLNGTAGTADATTTACQIGAAFQINADGNSANQPYATSRNDKIYPTALSAAKLTSITS